MNSNKLFGIFLIIYVVGLLFGGLLGIRHTESKYEEKAIEHGCGRWNTDKSFTWENENSTTIYIYEEE